MKRICISVLVAVFLVSFLFGSGNIALSTENSDVENIKAPFSSFTIAYQVDLDNPDPKRDNLSVIEYNSANGWRFFEVEEYLLKGQTKHRLKLDEDGNKIVLSGQNFRTELEKIFFKSAKFKLVGDFNSDKLTINYFCTPSYDGQCYNELVYEKSFLFRISDTHNEFLGSAAEFSCSPNYSSKFNPYLGTIQVIDYNLQFEQWDFNGKNFKLSHRKALNPSEISEVMCSVPIFNSILVRGYEMTTPYFELFIDKPYFTYQEKKYELQGVSDGSSFRPICSKQDDVIMVDLKSFAQLFGLPIGINYDRESDQCFNTLEIPYHLDGQNQVITFQPGSNIAKTHFGEDITMPAEATSGGISVVSDNSDNTYSSSSASSWSDCGSLFVPLLTVLDLLPRYNEDKGYCVRSITNSVLISTKIRNMIK